MTTESANDSYIPNRKCKVVGCDSTGHADGVSSYHFLSETCPIHLGLSQNQCQQIRFRLDRRSRISHCSIRDNSDSCSDDNSSSANKRSLRSRAKLFKRERWSPDTDKRKRLPIFYDDNVFKELKVRAAQMLTEELASTQTLIGEQYNTLPVDKQYLIYADHIITAPTCKHDSEKIRTSTVLYFCDCCLRVFTTGIQFNRHRQKCTQDTPPGTVIYKHNDNVILFEVDAAVHTQYCQNVCIIARRFLNHKTVHEHVQPFMFYILAINFASQQQIGNGDRQWKMAGYFSKMKVNDNEHNLSCLVILPPFMGQAFGTLLIDLSYKMSEIEQKVGTPERPFTDFGLCAYRSYWTEKIFEVLLESKNFDNLNIQSISQLLYIHQNDIVETLQFHKLVKSYKGQHIILKNIEMMAEYLEKKKAKRTNNCFVDTSTLNYQPIAISDIASSSA
ncbi:hypothetical protein GJ496_011863 [Pomphorhynchus laevis]|nr:hypothetical protein GJ496_011863 [Pomphorhynchus laevis]